MNTAKISVIVAAYNAEKYIARCLDSFLSQTMADFEVIVVDDGSKDATPAIVDEYAQRDPRFRIIHQTNRGVASARQAGMDVAKGEYFIHADSDDWVEADMLQTLYQTAFEQNLDMLICDYWEIFPNQEKYNSQKPTSTDTTTCFGLMLNNLAGSLWNKLIRRTCYNDYGISFDPEVHMEEDKLICLKLLSHPIRVGHIEKAFYHYDHTINSSSLCNKGNYAAPRLLVLQKISEYCDIREVQDYYDKAVFYIAYESVAVAGISGKEFNKVFKPYYSTILHTKGFPFRNKLILFLKMLGVNLPISGIKKAYNYDS